jgi:hypothetical protein
MADIIDNREDKPISYRGSEVIITRPAIEDETLHTFNGERLTNRQILSKINQSSGGLSFADGGEVPEEIHTTGDTYEYGGEQMADTAIVSKCGCKHKLKLPEPKNSKYFEKYQAGTLIPKKSFTDFKKDNNLIYRKSGKLFIPIEDGQGYYSYYSETTDPKGAVQEIYGMVADGDTTNTDYTHYADIFDIDQIYKAIDAGEIVFDVIEVPTEKCTNGHGRFNADLAENMEDIDFDRPQGIVLTIPTGLGLPATNALIDGRHRSHHAAHNGRSHMKVFNISDPEKIKQFLLPTAKNSFEVGGHIEGELTYREFMNRYGKFIYQDAYGDQLELVATLPTSYGQKYFSVPLTNYKFATKRLYQDYLHEKDRYSNGGEMQTFRYALTIRPFGIGTYPDAGFVRYEESSIYPFGILHYKAELEPNEMQHFDLIPLDLIESLSGKKIKWFENYEGTIEPMTDPAGKIVGIRVNVAIEDGEIVEEKMGVFKFLQNYYKGKWGLAYSKGAIV